MNTLKIRDVQSHSNLVDGFKSAVVAEILFDGHEGDVTLVSNDEESYDVWGDGPHCWCSAELISALSDERLSALISALQDRFV